MGVDCGAEVDPNKLPLLDGIGFVEFVPCIALVVFWPKRPPDGCVDWEFDEKRPPDDWVDWLFAPNSPPIEGWFDWADVVVAVPKRLLELWLFWP